MASTTPARKAVKAAELPHTVMASQTDWTQDAEEEQKATLYSVAMTAINFIAFLLSLIAVEIHYTLRRSAMGATAPGIMPRWLHTLLRPGEPYENYYRTKQRKLMRMEAEEAFRWRNRMLVVMAIGAVAGVGGVWWVLGRFWQRWARVVD